MNGTLDTRDQTAIQNEIASLKNQINRIGTDTEFNGFKLFDEGHGQFSLRNKSPISTMAFLKKCPLTL